LVAFDYGDVDEFARFLAARMLDHQQAGRGHFEHEAQLRNFARHAPGAKIVLAAPHPQMKAGALDGGRYTRERFRAKRNRAVENDGRAVLLRGKERQRDLRHESFFAPQAGPEGCVDHAVDGGRVRHKCDILPAAAQRFLATAAEIIAQLERDGGEGLARHYELWAGAAARARRIPSFSMRACKVLRLSPSLVAAPFGPLITQSAASSAFRI
jgi:hypothetical protein